MTPSSPEQERFERARLSLDGLSIGDGFGQKFFFPWMGESAGRNHLPERPWHYTDDTEMAMAIVQVLERSGVIDQDDLAATFAARYSAEPGRGYTDTTCAIIGGIVALSVGAVGIPDEWRSRREPLNW